MLKADIRTHYKSKRRKISSTEKEKLEDLILIQFQKLKLKKFYTMLSYVPIQVQNEYDPYLLEAYSEFSPDDLAMAYPIINYDTNEMLALIVHEDQPFELDRYGIPQPTAGIKLNPKDIDLIIVPLLAFDKNGYRVGYGKGYYDKFIAKCTPSVIKIGVSFFEPVEIDDIDEWDKKLDYCLTPEKTYSFKKK
jgi:5-formyltetrahydrofolate cyclo-ligase